MMALMIMHQEEIERSQDLNGEDGTRKSKSWDEREEADGGIAEPNVVFPSNF